MDLSSVHGNMLQMRFSHHYKSVDVRVQIKEMFIFLPIFQHFHSYFFASHLGLDTLRSWYSAVTVDFDKLPVLQQLDSMARMFCLFKVTNCICWLARKPSSDLQFPLRIINSTLLPLLFLGLITLTLFLPIGFSSDRLYMTRVDLHSCRSFSWSLSNRAANVCSDKIFTVAPVSNWNFSSFQFSSIKCGKGFILRIVDIHLIDGFTSFHTSYIFIGITLILHTMHTRPGFTANGKMIF